MDTEIFRPGRGRSGAGPVPLFVRAVLAMAVIAAFGVLVPPTADAQVRLGVHGMYSDQHQAYGIGPRVDIGVGGVDGLSVGGRVDHFFPDEGGLWGVSGSTRYSILAESRVSPYLGAGFSYMVDSEEEIFRDLPGGGGIYVGGEESMTGLDVMGGLEFRLTEGVTPFTHVRYTTAGQGQFILYGGILFF